MSGQDLFATLQQLLSLGNAGMAGMGLPQTGQPGAIGAVMNLGGGAMAFGKGATTLAACWATAALPYKTRA